jgi:hypothetical protein
VEIVNSTFANNTAASGSSVGGKGGAVESIATTVEITNANAIVGNQLPTPRKVRRGVRR